MLSCDKLLNGRVKLFQPQRGYRIAIDPVFLAAAVPATFGECVLDIGSGTGAAAICLASRIPCMRITGLELQMDLVDMANKSIYLNKLDHRVCFFQGDLLLPPKDLGDIQFDHVMANPPHMKRESVLSSPDPQKQIAHIEGRALLDDWLEFALENVRVGGTVTIVHRYDRRQEVVSGLAKGAGDIIVFPLWPKISGREAKRVIVQGKKGSEGKTKYSTGIVLYDGKGSFTTEANSILRDAKELNISTTCE